MKKISKKLSLLMVLLMVVTMALSLGACGGSGEAEPSEDGQNPIMNFVGYYVSGRANIFVSAEDSENGASAIVTWGSSATEYSSWTMSGTFDSETLQFEYHDCVKTDYVYEDGSEDPTASEVYTGGHGFFTFAEGDTLTLTWQDDQEHIADDMVFEYTTEFTPEDATEEIGMANPWSTAETLDEAAAGAGIDGISFVDGMELTLGPADIEEIRYMDGLVEIHAPAAAVEIFIRKGRADVATDGDISGDYNSYANEWTQNVKGLEVNCFGNREGEATKTIWTAVDGDYCYAILAYGAGGDDDFGLSADDLNSIINGLQ